MLKLNFIVYLSKIKYQYNSIVVRRTIPSSTNGLGLKHGKQSLGLSIRVANFRHETDSLFLAFSVQLPIFHGEPITVIVAAPTLEPIKAKVSFKKISKSSGLSRTSLQNQTFCLLSFL